MTFAPSMALLAAVAPILGGTRPPMPPPALERGRSGRRAVEAFMEVATHAGSLLEDVVDGREILAVLGRGSARAAAEMGADVERERGDGRVVRDGELPPRTVRVAGPDMAAIILSTEEQTRTLDLGLAADLASTGASVAVIAPGEEVPAGARIHSRPRPPVLFDGRGRAAPVARVAARAGRAPGVYTRVEGDHT